MRHLPSIRAQSHHDRSVRRLVRRTAGLFLLVAVVSSAVTATGARPAGAVPVDGRYTGRLWKGLSAVTDVTVRLDTAPGTRAAVTATLFIDPGITIPCFFFNDTAAT